VPKISRLMNDQERAICARLRQFRIATEWSQPDLAYWVDSTRNQIAAIETGRTPLRFRLGEELCLGLGISQRWLVEGKEPASGYITLGADVKRRIPPEILYSHAYHQFLKPLFDAHFESGRPTGDDIELDRKRKWVMRAVGEVDWEFGFNQAAAHLRALFEGLPSGLVRDLFARFVKMSEEFTYAHQHQLKAIHERRNKVVGALLKKNADFPLTESSDFHRKECVKSEIRTLKELLMILRRVMQPRGMRAALAKRLKISEASLSEWLRGKTEPGGEITLRLRSWVLKESEEYQKKTLPVRSTPAERRTRKRTSNETRQTQSGPPK
jgi:transcriptional regulator with XRE-family HTH domain